MIVIDKKEIGKIICYLRNQKNESQVELSEAIGVSSASIAAYELGTRTPSDDVKLRLAKHFNVPVQDIFYRTNEMNEEEPEAFADFEAQEIAKQIQKNEGLRTLFDATKKLSEEDVQVSIGIARKMFGDEK